MRLSRLALPLAFLAVGLLAPPSLAAATGSGGARAETLRQGNGGGGVAPERPGDARAAEIDAPSGAVAPPAAGPAQDPEPTPTTPEGEQQPTEEEPAPDEPEAAPAPEEHETELPAAQEPAPEPTAEAAQSTGAVGFLPSTGMEVAALAAIGLGLLMAGFALRPRKRVPAGTKRPDGRPRVPAGNRR